MKMSEKIAEIVTSWGEWLSSSLCSVPSESDDHLNSNVSKLFLSWITFCSLLAMYTRLRENRHTTLLLNSVAFRPNTKRHQSDSCVPNCSHRKVKGARNRCAHFLEKNVFRADVDVPKGCTTRPPHLKSLAEGPGKVRRTYRLHSGPKNSWPPNNFASKSRDQEPFSPKYRDPISPRSSRIDGPYYRSKGSKILSSINLNILAVTRRARSFFLVRTTQDIIRSNIAYYRVYCEYLPTLYVHPTSNGMYLPTYLPRLGWVLN